MKTSSFIYTAFAAALLLGSCSAPSNDSLWLGKEIPLEGTPYYSRRILNHWDNLDDTVERGYAGHSIWKWTSEEIPVEKVEQYGALNHAIGINGTVLNNVNASPKILDSEHLQRVAAIADILRPYDIRVYLSVNFASPSALGGLNTSDPLDEDVVSWWKDKVDEIYCMIPDFGGFLVKASSEGQPGPGDYGRSHSEGANMLADILAPHDGIVMWRAFVYSAKSPDRAMQAYDEFKPLDGQFRDNVTIQVKNGPVDFQPREPVSPLFWAMPETDLTPEVQITQEYLGQSKHLVFLAPMWKECLDVIPQGPAIAGVANIGQDDTWCGHIFSQANWYAFGRLAWDPTLSSEQIADEWLHLTFNKPWYVSTSRFEKKFIVPMKDIMLSSRETCVDYMMPLGLHHIFAWDHHYGPEPWCHIPGGRPDWMPSYYHKAAEDGVGFDRTRLGSGAVDQYPEQMASMYDDVDSCPENLLLWFHHLPWDYVMSSGNTLWDEMCLHYDRGVKTVREYKQTWQHMRRYVDADRWQKVDELLAVQVHDAEWWRDACVQYFHEFSHMDIPANVELPAVALDSLKQIHLKMGNHN